MQDYYRLLGVAATATAAEIEQAYQRQKARLSRRTADPAMKARLQEIHTGYEILGHPGRRLAYNVLLAQEPIAQVPPTATEVMMRRYAPAARWLNAGLLAFCLLLLLDWALPRQELGNEPVLVRQIVAVSSSASDPQMAYDVRTLRTAFRVPSRYGHRVRRGTRVTVEKTPLLGVVRRLRAPATVPGERAEFKPSGGNIYTSFRLLPIVLLVVAGLGLLPGRSPEMRVNTAVVGTLLALVVLVVLVWF